MKLSDLQKEICLCYIKQESASEEDEPRAKKSRVLSSESEDEDD